MNVNLNDYVNKRIGELTAFKAETLDSIKSVLEKISELSTEDEKELLVKKMEYYTAAGALAELEKLKKVLSK
ncbi:hypothetical protein [Cytobacillus dafuensis]|nr:hypothetical protein [Cytobacillus dafuensis]